MKVFEKIKYWIFDLDNTLYSGKTKVFEQVDKKMSKYISNKLNVTIEEAKKIQKKAAKAGFDWPDKTGPLNKLDEEVQEFKEALTKNNTDAITHEAGDILFTIVNCLRKLNIDPETALQQSNQRFMTLFKAM